MGSSQNHKHFKNCKIFQARAKLPKKRRRVVHAAAVSEVRWKKNNRKCQKRIITQKKQGEEKPETSRRDKETVADQAGHGLETRSVSSRENLSVISRLNG